MLVMLVARGANATQVSYRVLDRETVAMARSIFTADVVKATAADTPSDYRNEFVLANAVAVLGPLPTDPKRAVYVEMNPIMRDASGKEVGRVSVTLPGAGNERGITTGRWLFFAMDPGATAPIRVFRLEPVAKESEVRALLGATVDAGAIAPSAPPKEAAAAVVPVTAAAASSPPAPSTQPPARASGGCGVTRFASQADAPLVRWIWIAALGLVAMLVMRSRIRRSARAAGR